MELEDKRKIGKRKWASGGPKGDFPMRNGKLSNHARTLAEFEFRDE